MVIKKSGKNMSFHTVWRARPRTPWTSQTWRRRSHRWRRTPRDGRSCFSTRCRSYGTCWQSSTKRRQRLKCKI